MGDSEGAREWGVQSDTAGKPPKIPDYALQCKLLLQNYGKGIRYIEVLHTVCVYLPCKLIFGIPNALTKQCNLPAGSQDKSVLILAFPAEDALCRDILSLCALGNS